MIINPCNCCYRDKLSQSNSYPGQNVVHQQFERGRSRGLKSFTEVAGVRRSFEFYGNSRVDGMIKREEIIGLKVYVLHDVAVQHSVVAYLFLLCCSDCRAL